MANSKVLLKPLNVLDTVLSFLTNNVIGEATEYLRFDVYRIISFVCLLAIHNYDIIIHYIT